MSTSTLSRIVLITGANRIDGIGFAAARQLALQHGFTVLLGSRNLSPSLDDAIQQLKKDGAKNGVHPLQIDVASTDSVRRAATEVEEKFGKLDVLVNNAARGMPGYKATEHTRAHFEEVFAVNVFGVVDTINTFAPLLAKSSSPRIVNVSSGAGSLGLLSSLPGVGPIIYSTSKTALNMLTVMYSKDLPNMNASFKVNSACPGHTNTAFSGYTGGRTPDEAAAVITWLSTLPKDGPNGGFFCDHPPYSQKNGDFKAVEW